MSYHHPLPAREMLAHGPEHDPLLDASELANAYDGDVPSLISTNSTQGFGPGDPPGGPALSHHRPPVSGGGLEDDLGPSLDLEPSMSYHWEPSQNSSIGPPPHNGPPPMEIADDKDHCIAEPQPLIEMPKAPNENSMTPPPFELEASSGEAPHEGDKEPQKTEGGETKKKKGWEFGAGMEYARYNYNPNSPYYPNIPHSTKYSISASKKSSDYIKNSLKLSYFRGDYYPGSLNDPKADQGADVHKAQLDFDRTFFDKQKKHYAGINGNISLANKLEKTTGVYPTQYGPSPYLGLGLGLNGGARLGDVGNGGLYATGALSYNKDYSLKSSKSIETYGAEIGAMYKDPRFSLYFGGGLQNRPGLKDNSYFRAGIKYNFGNPFKKKDKH